jgi:[ribosomal protein S5]-alanine N-acetyltransferase|tara:strand:- start:126 stop:662 length:537 start_codon:yes stop_codon:yes gene_type:complete
MIKKNNIKKIKSKDILLKKIKPGIHLNKYFKWVNCKTVTRFTELKQTVTSKEDLKKYLESKNNSKNEFLFGIFFKKIYVGNIKIGPINKKLSSAPIGYLIGEKKYWNKGIASLAIKKIIVFGFKILKLKSITSNSETKNLFSAKALIKNNFKKIKKKTKTTLRDLYFYRIKNPKLLAK